MNVYFIYDKNSNSIKIGKANIVSERLDTLQVGNSNNLEVIHTIECKSVEHAKQLESELHKKYENHLIRGEWFHYDKKIYEEIIHGVTSTKRKSRRDPLTRYTLFGTEEIFGPQNSPDCFFYPHLTAQILDNFENAIKKTIPFRTMKYPTKGKRMLMPYSDELDRVFISTKKHNENLELNRFLKERDIENVIDNHSRETKNVLSICSAS